MQEWQAKDQQLYTLSSQARAIAAIKSLFTFAHQKTGLLGVNPAGAVSIPKVKDALAERILPEWVVHTMIGLEPNERNKAILRLLYIAGLRVSQLTQLAPAFFTATKCGWSSVVYGKGRTA